MRTRLLKLTGMAAVIVTVARVFETRRRWQSRIRPPTASVTAPAAAPVLKRRGANQISRAFGPTI